MNMARLALLGTTFGVALLAPGAEARGAQDDHAALHASAPDAGLAREVRKATPRFTSVPDPAAAKIAEIAGIAPLLGCVSGQPEEATRVHGLTGKLAGDRTRTAPAHRFGFDPLSALHVWTWRDNPHGTYADWSPRVSCGEFTRNPAVSQ